MISKNLRFAFPEVKVPATFLTPEFTLIPGFKVGVGDVDSRAAAQARIDKVNAFAEAEVLRRDEETAAKLKVMQDALSELTTAFQANVNDLSTNNSGNSNTSTTNNFNSGGVDVGLLPPGARVVQGKLIGGL